MPGAVDLGANFICRREVYDVLAAADGHRLPFKELVARAEPRLRKYALKEIENAGGTDAYLRARLELFTVKHAVHPRMVTVEPDDTVVLQRNFKLRMNLPSGSSAYYQPGLAAAVEWVDRLNQNIAEMRHRKRWDCLPPSGDEAELRESIAAVGWLHDQKIIADRGGYIIDGRVRDAIMADRGESRVPVKFNGRGLPETFGLVYAFHANQSRLTPRDQGTYRNRVEKELGLSWADLMDLYRLTYEWQTAAPKVTIDPDGVFRVESHGVDVSEDLQYVKIRDILQAAGMPIYGVKEVKIILEEFGCDCIQPIKSGSQSAAWMRIDDIERIVSISSDDYPVWPNMPERRVQLRTALRSLLDLRGAAEAQLRAAA